MVELSCVTIFFLTTVLVLARGRPPADLGQGSPAAGAIQPDWVIRNPGPGLDRPKSPRAARGPAGLLRPLGTRGGRGERTRGMQ